MRTHIRDRNGRLLLLLLATAACGPATEVEVEGLAPSLMTVSVDVLSAGTRLDPQVEWTPLTPAGGLHALDETVVALRLTATWKEEANCTNRPLQNATLTLGPGLRLRPGGLETEEAARKDLGAWRQSFGTATADFSSTKKAVSSVVPAIDWSDGECTLTLPLLVTGAAAVARGEVKLSVEGVGNATVAYSLPAIAPKIVRVFTQEETKATGPLLPLEDSGTAAFTFPCADTSTTVPPAFAGSYAGGSLAVCVDPVNRHRLAKPVALETEGAVLTPRPTLDCPDTLLDVAGEEPDHLVWLVRPKSAGELTVKAHVEGGGSAVRTTSVRAAVAVLETVERTELDPPEEDAPGRYRERLTFCTSFDGFVPVSLADATAPLELLTPTQTCRDNGYPASLRVVRIADGVRGSWQFVSSEGTRTGVVWDVLEGGSCE